MFVLVIGSMDTFSTEDELMSYYYDPEKDVSEDFVNASIYKISGEYGDDTARLILFGMAFSDDWCADGTISYFFKE